jgi:hypothetical protein
MVPGCVLSLGKGDALDMRRSRHAVETLVRQAFSLVVELRTYPEAQGLLTQAVEVLKYLAQHEHNRALPLLISVRALRLPKT